jgi:hypothetical protein
MQTLSPENAGVVANACAINHKPSRAVAFPRSIERLPYALL